MNTIQAKKRSKTEKLDMVRSNELIPAVVYGAGIESTPLSVPAQEFIKLFKEVGESEVITLDVEGQKINALIHEVQWHPVKDEVMHADFYAVDMNKDIQVSVPINFDGVSEAVKRGGILVKVLHEIEVKAMPKNLPHEIVVDISKLQNLHDQIHVGDIVKINGVTILNDAEEVICVVEPANEESNDESSTMDLSQIEVEKKGKKEEDSVE